MLHIVVDTQGSSSDSGVRIESVVVPCWLHRLYTSVLFVICVSCTHTRPCKIDTRSVLQRERKLSTALRKTLPHTGLCRDARPMV